MSTETTSHIEVRYSAEAVTDALIELEDGYEDFLHIGLGAEVASTKTTITLRHTREQAGLMWSMLTSLSGVAYCGIDRWSDDSEVAGARSRRGRADRAQRQLAIAADSANWQIGS